MGWLLSGLILLLLLPLRLTLTLHRTDSTAGSVCLCLAFFRLTRRFCLLKTTDGGLQLILLPRRGPPASPSPPRLQQFGRAMKAFRRCDKARRLLRRHLRLERLSLFLRAVAGDASVSALVTGTLQALDSVIPQGLRDRVYLRAVPDYRGGGTVWRLQCIVSAPLGILSAAITLAWLGWLRTLPASQKEAEKWNDPSLS